MPNLGFILFVIVDILLLVGLIIWLMRYQNKKNRSRTMKEFDAFVEANHLVLEKKQTLNKNIIGIDKEQMKLVFLDRKNKINPLYLIDLHDVESCKLVKSRKTEKSHIKSISLELFLQNKERVVLGFYHEKQDKFYKMMRLAKKAYWWDKTINLYKEMATTVPRSVTA